MTNPNPVAPASWSVVDGHSLRREFKFPDFAAALAFVNRVGETAERQQHHPDIELGWGRAVITTYTHTANGLTPKDYALAEAINGLI